MRVLFILPHPIEGPSSRFRVYQYIPYLREHGIECDIRPFVSSEHVQELYATGNTGTKIVLTLRGLAARMRDVVYAQKYDIVFILREAFALGPPFLERALKKACGRMVFDFDDAIYTRSLAYDNPVDRLRDFSKTAKVIAAADTIITGSSYLAAYAKQHSQSTGQVRVLPTVVDDQIYRPKNNRAKDETITLGWIGTPRGSHYVADLMPVFKELCNRFQQLRMVFVGVEPFDTENLPIELRDWSLKREIDDISDFDIGIMPLTDDEETRGKCGFKIIQYMSCGVAPVVSPVGANTDIVTDGETGLFANTPNQWRDQISRLIEDETFRKQMAEKGRQRVAEQYSLSVTAPKLLEILRETAAR
ncbi:glycosyltransferase family 4 protein [Sneathiella sp.]|uniref:glycosyltransferase family 4 protein n=1 Tax=Sneathiella sp. TaxID=1964365 RepID=UPI0039E6D19E